MSTPHPRTAHYVSSTHWDREWYEPLQGFRMRLVSLLDEVFDVMARDPRFATFVMDGQSIPIADYLEIRPERAGDVRRLGEQRRFRAGPWYVLPDEWLVSGESIIRNIQLGMRMADELAGGTSRAGFVCDQFGHISQLPQLFSQLGIGVAYVWRGTHERDHHGHFNWQSPDGTVVPTYRFGVVGYCTIAARARHTGKHDEPFDLEATAERLVAQTLAEGARSSLDTILLFDGGDHLEIEPRMADVIAIANARLAADRIQIVHSDLDRYGADVLAERSKITLRVQGELRETGRDPAAVDEQWLIPGVYSSRIPLKQANARCEDELCLWAEPFSALAAREVGAEWPEGYLRVAWRHLLDNHPHDSMCGCSHDQVHRDMVYRFDQSMGISSRLSDKAMRTIARAATSAADRPENALVLGVFNAASRELDEPIDLDVALPTDWPTKWQEFFGFEEKFAFKLIDAEGKEVAYQLVGQRRDVNGFRCPRYKFPKGDPRHVISVTARLRVPAVGYATLLVVPHSGPTRYSGPSLATNARTIENEFLRVFVNPNGTVDITDKRTGKTFLQALTIEDRADIGDGWYHGVAVNDQIYTSTASSADVALVADGPLKATLRIAVTMNVPAEFDFRAMARSNQTVALKIVSEVSLRAGLDRLEVVARVVNTARDHRVRVLMPTGLSASTFMQDSPFDAVERRVGLSPDNNIRKELDVETRPQQTWTAVGDGDVGLAVVCRGLPEATVCDTVDRPIALTLYRSFRKVIFRNGSTDAQLLESLEFGFTLISFAGEIPVTRLFVEGQRALGRTRAVTLTAHDFAATPLPGAGALPRSGSSLEVVGEAVVTSVQRDGGQTLVRLFNPTSVAQPVTLRGAFSGAAARTLDGHHEPSLDIKVSGKGVEFILPAKRLATLRLS